MLKNDFIKRICNIPIDFRNGEKSSLELAQESGIQEVLQTINAEQIEEYLNANSDLIEAWQIWSLDKRVNSGYYLQLGSKPIVGFYENGSLSIKKEFNSSTEACADFILKEVSSILNQNEI